MTQPQQPSGAPTRFCSNCGTSLSPQASFCAHCGQPIQAPGRFCSSCGAQMRAEASFCPECGTAVPSIPEPSATPSQQAQQPVEPPEPQVWEPSLAPTPADRGLPASIGLAGRGARLGAVIIDGLIAVIPYLILAFIAPTLGLLAFAAIFIFQIVLLTKDGQTLGKKALNIRIVKVDTGQNGGFVSNVLLRVVVNGLLGFIPLYGLVDPLFIFRADRRCIHDFIAGTQVIEA